MSKTKAYDVFLPTSTSAYHVTGLKKIDTVFYSLSESDGDPCEYVRQSLINHDGYSPAIVVKAAR